MTTEGSVFDSRQAQACTRSITAELHPLELLTAWNRAKLNVLQYAYSRRAGLSDVIRQALLQDTCGPATSPVTHHALLDGRPFTIRRYCFRSSSMTPWLYRLSCCLRSIAQCNSRDVTAAALSSSQHYVSIRFKFNVTECPYTR
jgi:hypothetical protein